MDGIVKLGEEDANIPQSAEGYEFNTYVNGAFDIEKVRWSYNHAIQTLNDTIEQLFPTDNIIDDSRCVGSMPGYTNGVSNKYTRNSTMYVHGTYNTWFTNRQYNSATYINHDNTFEQGEELYEVSESTYNHPNYISDYNKMEALGITGIGQMYWLASRKVEAGESRVSFEIFAIGIGGTPSEGRLGYFDYTLPQAGGAGEYSFGMR